MALKYVQTGKTLAGQFEWNAQNQLTVPIPFSGFNTRDGYTVAVMALYTQRQIATVASATDDTDYTLVVGNFPVTIDSGTAATTTTIAAALVAAIQADAGLNAAFTASNTGAVITITSRVPGRGFTLSSPSAITIGAVSLPSLPGFTVTDYQNGQFTITSTSNYTGKLFVTVNAL
jgi:phage tail sheath gpL-like